MVTCVKLIGAIIKSPACFPIRLSEIVLIRSSKGAEHTWSIVNVHHRNVTFLSHGGIHEMYQSCMSLLTTTDFRASWKMAAEDNWPSVHWDTLFKVNKQLFKAAEHLYPISERAWNPHRWFSWCYLEIWFWLSAKCLFRISAALRLFSSYCWEKQASLWIRSLRAGRIGQNLLGVLNFWSCELQTGHHILGTCWYSRFITSDGLFGGRNWLWLA